jgi:hypothetical protein
MAERDPRMLPGMSARTAETIVESSVGGFIAILLLTLLGALVASIAGSHGSRFAAVIGLILGTSFLAAAALFAIFYPVRRRMQRLELDAGYTTLQPEFNQFDGINPRTGHVSRPAVVRTPGVSVVGAISTGIELGGIETGRTAASLTIKSPPAALEVLCIAVLVGASWWMVTGLHGGTALNVVVAFVWIAAVCGVILIPLIAFGSAPSRYYVARLQDHYPGDRVFDGEPHLSDIGAELVEPGTPALPEARHRHGGFVVVGRDSMVLYSRHESELLPYLAIPRSRISDAKMGSVVVGPRDATNPAVDLNVTKDNGSTFSFTLALKVAWGSTRGITSACQWIIGWATSAS